MRARFQSFVNVSKMFLSPKVTNIIQQLAQLRVKMLE